MLHLVRSRLAGVVVLLAAAPVAIAGITVAAHADGGRGSGRDLGGVTDTLLPSLGPTPEPTASATPTTNATAMPTGTPPVTLGAPSTPTASSGVPMVLGADGTFHPAGRQIVKSQDRRELFWGEDFDTSCHDGSYFAKGLSDLGRLARVIEESGRRAVVVVAPNKSVVDTPALKGVEVPFRTCARKGLFAQRNLLRTLRGPHYLSVLRALEASKEPTYWRTDTHWNPVGAGIYARRLGLLLDRETGRSYGYREKTFKRLGDLAELLNRRRPEVGIQTTPTSPVRVRPAPGTPHVDTYKVTTPDYSWVTTPARRAVAGRTLLVGDSFTYIALRQLRPLLAHGRFLWTGLVEPERIIAGMQQSDTVVIEVVQRYVARSPLGSDKFIAAVAAALSTQPPTT